MLKTDHEDLIGNDKYYGFAVDLIDVISQVLGFTYEIIIVHDGKFGSKLTNGEWDGIVGEILSGVSTSCMRLTLSMSLLQYPECVDVSCSA